MQLNSIALTITDDKAEELAVHCQACIYGSDSTLPISYRGFKAIQPCRMGLKTVQPYRVLIWGLRQSNRAELLIVMDQGYPLITYLGLKATRRVLNRSKTVPDVITVRFDRPA